MQDRRSHRKVNTSRVSSKKAGARDRDRAKNRKKSNRSTMVAMAAATFVLLVVLSVAGGSLKEKASVYGAKEAQLEQMIMAEQERTRNIESEKKYRQTLSYVEDVAREKLGLVYPNETIYKSDK